MELARRANRETDRAEDARRARLILLLADGHTQDEASERIECSRDFVASWTRRPASHADRLRGGRCGYGLTRELIALGYRWELISVTAMPRKPGERIKTNLRDALTLARHLRAPS
jgi:transposase